MSVQDFIHTAGPPPEWLANAWAGSKRRGLDANTLDEISTEIAAARLNDRARSRQEPN